MTLKAFVKKYRRELDGYIQSAVPGARKNDEERQLWVLNDEYLYHWALRSGVKEI